MMEKPWKVNDYLHLLRVDREYNLERVVHCRDCKFYRKTTATTMDYFDYINGNAENKKSLYMCDNDVIDWATPEDYCSLGVRRE